jgi:hypothetical protein
MSFIEPAMTMAATAGMGSDIGAGIGTGADIGSAAGGVGNMLGPLSMASTAMGAAGSVVQGVMGFVGGMQQAKQAQKAAALASIEGGIQTQERLLQGGQTLGRAATLAAASGGGLGGTTAGILNQIAEHTMFNARGAAYRGATEADKDLYMSKVDKDNAINSLIGGVTGGATQAVAGGLQQNFRQQLLQSQEFKAGGGDMYTAMSILS